MLQRRQVIHHLVEREARLLAGFTASQFFEIDRDAKRSARLIVATSWSEVTNHFACVVANLRDLRGLKQEVSQLLVRR